MGSPNRNAQQVRRAHPSWIATAIVLTGVSPLLAQIVPNGPEIQVNTYTTDTQFWPDAATTPDGGAVVVWTSRGSAGSDTSSTSIQARLFDRAGRPCGEQFQVNSFTTSRQNSPSVASTPSGDFVVAWTSNGSYGTDNFWESIQARRFSSSGIPLSGQFQVNTYTVAGQYRPDVATDDDGSFVVVWDSEIASPGSDHYWSVQARVFDAQGVPLGEQLQVNTYTYGWQMDPAVTRAADGGFVVAWVSRFFDIQGRRFDAHGVPLGGEFLVTTSTAGEPSGPALASNDHGGFVVTWGDSRSYGTDTGDRSVQARLFDAAGTPSTPEFQVNEYTSGDQTLPAVAMDPDGAFVITWRSEGSSGLDSSGLSVQARRFSADGAASTDEFQVNGWTSGDQGYGAVTVDSEGNFVVAWTSQGSFGTDTDAESIQAQRYDALFRDGVESSDTARWSSVQP